MNMHELVEKINTGKVTEKDLEKFQGKICQKAVQEALKALPQVTDFLVKQSHLLHKLSKQFYEKNPDLAENRDLVVSTIEEVESANPGLSYEKVLEKVTPLVKEKMKHIPRLAGTPGKPVPKEIDSRLGDI